MMNAKDAEEGDEGRTAHNVEGRAGVEHGERKASNEATTTLRNEEGTAAAASSTIQHGEPSASHQESGSEMPGVNALDDVKRASEWMAKGFVDSKGLAKRFPHTARDLCEGKLSPEEFAASLSSVYDLSTVKFKNMDRDVDPFVYSSHDLAMLAIPEKWREGSHEEQFDETRLQFSRDVYKYVMKRRDEGEYYVRSAFHQALEKTCEAWAERLDSAFFRRKSGAFLRFCPLYGLSQDEFRPVFDELWKELDERKLSDDQQKAKAMKAGLLAAAKELSQGVHDVEKTCWECAKMLTGRKVCGKCNLASYCTRECQVTAWKSGHKKKCGMLSSKYALFQVSLETTDAAHETGMMHGIHLSDYFDYNLVTMMHIIPPPFEFPDLAGPTMEIFYENLGRIVRGEWWVFTETDSVNVYESKLDHALRSEEYPDATSEREYFLALSNFLAFNYIQSAAQQDIVDAEVVAAMFREKYGGAAMPAERYIQYYKGSVKCKGARERSNLRRQAKTRALQAFRNDFHK